jgi:hypothetical protein
MGAQQRALARLEPTPLGGAGAGFVTGTATTGRLAGGFCGRHRCTRPTKASGPKDGDTVQCCRPAWRG